jgi:hypothetical protein
MPIILPYIFEAVVTYLADAGVGILATEIIAGAVTLVAFAAVTYGAQMLMSLFAKRPPLQTNQQLIKSPISPRTLIYGRVQCSGTLVYLQQSGSKNGDLYMVVAYAANSCAGVDQLNLGEFQITYDAATGNFNGEVNLNNGVVSQNFKGLGSFYLTDTTGAFHFGRLNQTLDQAFFTATVGAYGSASTLNGICYVGYHLIYNQNVFGGGVPNPTAIWRGAMLLDPRTCQMPTGTITSGSNLLTLSSASGLSVGNNVIGTGILDGTTITALNGVVATLSANAYTNVLNQIYIAGAAAYSNNAALCIMDYMMNKKFGFKANPGDFDLNSLIASLNNCDEQVQLVDGTYESRYTLNTVIDTSQTPGSNLNDMLTAMAGEIVWAGGSWYLYSGAWRPPTVTLSENDFASTPMIPTMPSRRDLINSVKGLFVCPQQFWEPTDYPPLQEAPYIAQDQGEVLWLDLQLSATTSAATAQRLAKIALLRARVGTTTVSLSCKLTALVVQCGDNIYLNYARMGWVNQLFECTGFVFAVYNDKNGKATLGINLTLRGTASTCWNWQAGSEIPLPQGPASTLPSPFTVSPPTNLSVTSNQSTVYIAPDGTIVPALQCVWTPPLDAQVQDGGIIQMQFRVTGSGTWIDLPDMEGTSELYYITNVVSGIAYDVRIRAVNPLGVDSPWDEVDDTVVSGNTNQPTIPAGNGLTSNGVPPCFFASTQVLQFGTMAYWQANTAPNFAFYEVKSTFFNNPNDTTYTWFPASAGGMTMPYPTRELYCFLYNPFLQPGFTWVRSVDTSGNRSAWLFLGNANGFATIGIGSISTQSQSGPSVQALQVGQVGAGSVVPQNAVAPFTYVYVATGGSPTERFIVSIAGMGFTAKPSTVQVSASDAGSISEGLLCNYNFDDASNTSQQIALTLNLGNTAGNIAAGPHRLSITLVQ